jgi:hypothetical protein
MNLDENERKVFAAIGGGKSGKTYKEIALATSLTTSAVSKALKRLREQGAAVVGPYGTLAGRNAAQQRHAPAAVVIAGLRKEIRDLRLQVTRLERGVAKSMAR